MPDTTPARPVIGVCVHNEDGAETVYDLGRDWHIDPDGRLDVVAPYSLLGLADDPANETMRTIAQYNAGAWSAVELVHAEPEPPQPAVHFYPGNLTVKPIQQDQFRQILEQMRDALRAIDRAVQ